ncbi:hypothetical protein KAW43_00210 [Candidatus Parcubacteria bacterium]|nr:hypothetical protein [Candidatus Parcubacteria bacterium]
MPFFHSYHHQLHSRHHSIKNTVFDISRVAKLSKLFISVKERLPKQARHIVFVNFLYGATGVLGGLFINIFLWKQSHNFLVLIKYNLISHIITLAVFFLIGFVLYRIHLRLLMQIGLLVLVSQYLLFIIFQENASQMVWYLGFLSGLGGGLYWAGHNIFEYLSTDDSNRDIYFGLKASLGCLISIIFPALGGLIIFQNWIPFLPQNSFANYYILFSAVVFIFVACILYIFRLPRLLPPRVDGSHLFIARRSSIWRLISAREFLDGLKGGSVGFLACILAFTVLNSSELNLGIFISFFALLSAVISLLVGGALTVIEGNRDRLIFGFVGASLIAMARVIYIAFFNVAGIITSSIIKIFAQPFFGIGLAPTFYHAIDQSHKHQKEFFEYMIAREMPLALGRIIGVLAFLLFLRFGTDMEVAKAWFLILGFVPLIFWFLTWKFENTISGLGDNAPV